MPLTRLRQHLECREYYQARREAERLIQTGDLVGWDLVQAYRGAALADYHLQNVFAAIKLGERALETAQSLGLWELIGKARYDLGEFSLTLGDYHQAYDYLIRFLRDLPQYPSLAPMEAGAQHNLALVFRKQNRHDEATAAHLLAAELHRQSGNQRQMVEALRGVIWCHLTRGEPEGAWPYIMQIATDLQALPDERLAASLLTDFAYYYQQAGDLKTSTSFCAEVMVPGRPGVDDHILATACVIAGENAAILNRRQEARIFTYLAEEYALRARHPGLMNRTAALRRHLHEQESGSAAEA